MSPFTPVGHDSLPDASKDVMDFVDSSFFNVPDRQLPDPSTIGTARRREIVRFPEMQLIVKHGLKVNVDEAITMWAIRKWLGDQVPVPELYGWRRVSTDEGKSYVFIYMELKSGVTLEDRYNDPMFSEEDKITVCEELKAILQSLHQFVDESSSDRFIGSITRNPLHDNVFDYLPAAGPFENLDKFYDWMEWLPQRFLEPSQRYRDPFLQHMPTDSAIVFTHADVHPKNIMVSTSTSGPARVLALIDWGQSGWCPDWWEYFKMCWITDWEQDWRKERIPRVVEARENELYLFAEYCQTIGAI